MAKLGDLPAELLIYIFSNVPFTAIAALLQTSKSINQLISNSTVLQYLFHLQISSHSPFATTSFPNSLKRLKMSEDGWGEWKIRSRTQLNVRNRPSGIYDLTCGIFVLGQSAGGGITSALNWVDLRKEDELVWNTINLKQYIIDLALNVHEWDLIAIFTVRLVPQAHCLVEMHLLQLSTSKDSVIQPHPLAAQPLVPILSYPALLGYCRLAIEIVGVHLALLVTYPFSAPSDKLYIFNWKTGRLLFTRQAERMTYHSLGFLSEDVLLLPNRFDGTLELCSFSQSSKMSSLPVTMSPDDECQQINPDFGSALPLRTAVKLALPGFCSQGNLATITCRGEPTPYFTKSQPKDVQDGPMFLPRSESAIVIFNLLVEDDDNPLQLRELRSLSFVTHRDNLMARVNATLSETVSDDTPIGEIKIEWEDWGPRSTRWFVTDAMSSGWVTTSCGQRWVTIKDTQLSPICIRDFNPTNIRRVINALGGGRSYETDDAVITVVDEPSSIPHEFPSVLSRSIESELPYLEIVTKEQFKYASVFMSESWLLGIVLADPDGKIKRVDIFSVA